MTMARRLDVALHETILAHAKKFQKDEVELEAILDALSSVAATYLSTIEHPAQRKKHYRVFCRLTAKLIIIDVNELAIELTRKSKTIRNSS